MGLSYINAQQHPFSFGEAEVTQLVRFSTQQGESWGVKVDDGIRDVGTLLGSTPKLADAIADWDSLQKRIADILSDAPLVSDGAKILCPFEDGGKVICIGLNYRDHAIETGAEIPTEPVVFCKVNGALCGMDDEIPLPTVSSQVDYEAELVVVIGKRAWQVPEAEADEYIFGYACGHDVSARDWQKGRPGGQWLLGKSFPNFAPLGPYVVPKANVQDPCNLNIKMRVNDEVLQDSNTSQLIFNPWQLIAHLTQCFVLEPGDVIFTGTPPGVGAARSPAKFLKPGDTCEVEVEGLGILRNRCV